jgi:hypothetical protein
VCDRCLAPREIVVDRPIAAPELVALTQRAPIERGKPRKVLDGAGWVFGIPAKIILWDRRVENHRVSATTEGTIAEYLADNDLEHVKVRINQYAPLEDWRRLRKNRTVGWPLRYTIGTLSVAAEAVFPGRLLGGDHYNPWTATIHLYSDVPAIAIHEGDMPRILPAAIGPAFTLSPSACRSPCSTPRRLPRATRWLTPSDTTMKPSSARATASSIPLTGRISVVRRARPWG